MPFLFTDSAGVYRLWFRFDNFFHQFSDDGRSGSNPASALRGVVTVTAHTFLRLGSSFGSYWLVLGTHLERKMHKLLVIELKSVAQASSSSHRGMCIGEI